mmetsp:Transcript_38719/g.106915  ORF Transcript_38719/g.106915 Transcript_38719/m.106915 type:complete len:276 (+) Transcript_38719:393-1220(+)
MGQPVAQLAQLDRAAALVGAPQVVGARRPRLGRTQDKLGRRGARMLTRELRWRLGGAVCTARMRREAGAKQRDRAVRREHAHVVQRRVGVRLPQPQQELAVARVTREHLRFGGHHDGATARGVRWAPVGAVRGEEHRHVEVPLLRGREDCRLAVEGARVDARARRAKQRGAVEGAGVGGGVEWRCAWVASGHGLIDVGSRSQQDRRAQRSILHAGDEERRAPVVVSDAGIGLRCDQRLGHGNSATRAAHVQRRLKVRPASHVEVGTARYHTCRAR